MTDSRFPSLRRQRAFENYLKNTGEAFFRHHPKLLHLRWIHDRLNHRQQDFDDQFGRNILAHLPRALPFAEKSSEVALDWRGPTAFDEFEDLRRFRANFA